MFAANSVVFSVAELFLSEDIHVSNIENVVSRIENVGKVVEIC